MTLDAIPDVLIIGSGMGGASVAAGLAPSGARIVILERGERLPDTPQTRDVHAIFQRGHFRPQERWIDGAGVAFNPGNYYYVGGNTKLYGAVLLRYRREDFSPIAHLDGDTPGWPFSYDELEPWYSKAEQLYQVRGALGEDPTEPPHSAPYPYGPVADEAAIALVRHRMKAVGLHPASLPLGIDIDCWLKHAQTPWDAYPDAGHGKMDAESGGLASALAHNTVRLQTGARVLRLLKDTESMRITGVEVEEAGTRTVIRAGIVILAAGAVNSAALLLQSGNLANASDQVGRHFMNHNTSAVLAIDPRTVNDSVYQKTLMINDFYLSDGKGKAPLGNIQLLGRVTAPVLKANIPRVPEWMLHIMSRHAVDWYTMSEDLPRPQSRVTVKGSQIHLDWRRSNWTTHEKLVAALKERLRAAGYPLVVSRPFDRRTPSHQCGTVRMGNDPALAPLDAFCRSYDHPNLFVVDASFLPTSAAVNPSLTIAAQALRVADHIRRHDLKS